MPDEITFACNLLYRIKHIPCKIILKNRQFESCIDFSLVSGGSKTCWFLCSEECAYCNDFDYGTDVLKQYASFIMPWNTVLRGPSKWNANVGILLGGSLWQLHIKLFWWRDESVAPSDRHHWCSEYQLNGEDNYRFANIDISAVQRMLCKCELFTKMNVTCRLAQVGFTHDRLNTFWCRRRDVIQYAELKSLIDESRRRC